MMISVKIIKMTGMFELMRNSDNDSMIMRIIIIVMIISMFTMIAILVTMIGMLT